MTYRYSEYDRGWQRGYRIGLRAATGVDAAMLRAKDQVIMALTGINERQKKELADLGEAFNSRGRVISNMLIQADSQHAQIKKLEEVNAALQQNVDELTARMPSKPERRDPNEFRVGDLVRHKRHKDKIYHIVAILPTTQLAKFQDYERQGWFPLSDYTRVEA